MDGVGGELAWVTWVACLRGWRASMGGMLTWAACLHGWRANVSYVVGVLAWVTCQRG